jgi:poly[(R)-3-hydroxyalkanoate] polymerase subunit PhaE
MTVNPWEDFARRSRELYEQQAELAKSWLDGQSRLAGTFAKVGTGDDGTGPGQDAAALAELWRSWLALGGSLGAAMPGLAEPGEVAGETLGRFLDPMSLALVGGSQVGETIRKLTEGPRFADLGALERRMAKVLELWLRVQRAARAYEAVVAGAWAEANRRFASEFHDLYRAGKAPTQPKEVLKLWLDVANRTLLETHRSDPFLNAQGELLRHGMSFLLAEREMVESMVEPAGLPTRAEIDEVHRSVQELKRRVRQLEKTAAAAQEAGKPSTARAATTVRKLKPRAQGAPA